MWVLVTTLEKEKGEPVVVEEKLLFLQFFVNYFSNGDLLTVEKLLCGTVCCGLLAL